MTKSERRKLDNEYLESTEWMGWDCIPEEFIEDKMKTKLENKEEITWKEVKEYLENYREKTMLLANFLPDINSIISKMIQAIDDEDDEVFEVYLSRLFNIFITLNNHD